MLDLYRSLPGNESRNEVEGWCMCSARARRFWCMRIEIYLILCRFKIFFNQFNNCLNHCEHIIGLCGNERCNETATNHTAYQQFVDLTLLKRGTRASSGCFSQPFAQVENFEGSITNSKPVEIILIVRNVWWTEMLDRPLIPCTINIGILDIPSVMDGDSIEC